MPDVPNWMMSDVIRRGIDVNPVLRSLELHRWIDHDVPRELRMEVRNFLLQRGALDRFNGEPLIERTIQAFAVHIESVLRDMIREGRIPWPT